MDDVEVAFDVLVGLAGEDGEHVEAEVDGVHLGAGDELRFGVAAGGLFCDALFDVVAAAVLVVVGDEGSGGDGVATAAAGFVDAGIFKNAHGEADGGAGPRSSMREVMNFSMEMLRASSA